MGADVYLRVLEVLGVVYHVENKAVAHVRSILLIEILSISTYMMVNMNHCRNS